MFTLNILSVDKAVLSFTHSGEPVATLNFQNLNGFLKFLVNAPHTTRIIGLEKLRSEYFPCATFSNGKLCEKWTVRKLYLNYSPETISQKTGIPLTNVKKIVYQLKKTRVQVKRYRKV